MLNLKTCAFDGGVATAVYMADAGPLIEGGERLMVPIKLIAGADGATASAEFGALAASADEDGALEDLANLLEKTAAAIRARGEAKFGIPIYG
ncbi:hypothetical protein [Paucibacter soli]|uniref:hypothetical protein n=1 Tax=Paucibacter soli TaxID=3133433 RepID=UPI0030A0ACB2